MNIACMCNISEMQNYNIQLSSPPNFSKSSLEDFWENFARELNIIILHLWYGYYLSCKCNISKMRNYNI